ncbi:MAG: putative selenate reductase subunit YgfK [Salinivirgaceae bacterium]
MNDKFSPISIDKLLKIIISGENSRDGFLGISFSLSKPQDAYLSQKTQLFNQTLDFPLGVAAGPHSQLVQNIISAWLCGARYIELKTIQTLDELEVEKPCINMQDEGYNCEWSQELTIKETYSQYLDAWILLHVLNHKMGNPTMDGTIFNMSVGYNMEGILKENVQWFLNKMQNCSVEKVEKIALLKPLYPQIDEIEIPDIISNNITLSTMHGCPPDEIEKIAIYLIEKRKLHTYIKLNPTLLGPVELRKILNDTGHFETQVPDEAFGHDLKYPDAVSMIERLLVIAKNTGVSFGLKLTNTLESINHKGVFSQAPMMYMSGRALHPISVNVARKLQNEFKGDLDISFAGGADAFNFSELIACGLTPVTVSSDILKPGGYLRLKQYLEELNSQLLKLNANTISDFTFKKAGEIRSLKEAQLTNLNRYADEVLTDSRYQRTFLKTPDIKGKRKLGIFDCIEAPCRENCATAQDIPEYLNFTANGNFDEAFSTILKTNPLPGITGNICDHLCQLRCTRINYDDALQIREIKRFVEENHSNNTVEKAGPENGKKVAIIGAGPSGLSCAYYLRLAGFAVELFEKSDKAGGMVAHAVPSFRLSDEKIARDVERVTKLGAKIHYHSLVNKNLFDQLYQSFDFLYIASGAPLSSRINIPGNDAIGVLEPLEFLFNAKLGINQIAGKKVAIIGGGNTAMDAARVAYRLIGEKGKVTLIYRRTINEMPADLGEIKAVLEEGIEILELTAPEAILEKNGAVAGLRCAKMELVPGKKGERPKPQKIEASEFELPFDIIIPAVGQEVAIDFMDKSLFKPDRETFEIKLKRVYTGGDVMRGAATAIKAINDGRRVAERIASACQTTIPVDDRQPEKPTYSELMALRAKRRYAVRLTESPLSDRKSFNPVSFTLTADVATKEAERCLQCQELCNICVTVCPNRANYHYTVEPTEIQLYQAVRGAVTVTFEADKVFKVTQAHQILNIADFCNECGNCSTFCPTSGAPYKDKPKFYLTIKSFNQTEEGYFLSKVNNKQILIFKEHGGIRTLEKQDEQWIYETDHVKAIFSNSGFALLEVEFKVPCAQQVHFDMAAEMKVLYHAAEGLYS